MKTYFRFTGLMFCMAMLTVVLLTSCGGGGGGGSAAAAGTKTYTVAYDGNGNTGGNVPVDSTKYKQGATVTVLDNTGNLVRSGYTFTGWNTAADGSGTGYAASGGATFTMGSASVLLYARWIIPVPDTGQTTCYDSGANPISCAGTGQDGAYTIHPMSFTDNGDGTIKDNVTGLTWQKCSMGQSGSLCSAGTATTYNLYQAKGIYDAVYNPDTTNVCGSLDLAGTGWRLPTGMELLTIVDYENSFPSVDAAFFPNTQYLPYDNPWYWSFSRDRTLVDFGLGETNWPTVSTEQHYIRCVRGTSISVAKNYKDNGNGTVTDLTTNLMWQQCTAGYSTTTTKCDTASGITTYLWEDAISYCESLSLGGFADWRLPNVKELRSLVDDAYDPSNPPAVNMTYFPIPSTVDYDWYWSATTLSYIPSNALSVDLMWGLTSDGQAKTVGNYVRCVRSGQ